MCRNLIPCFNWETISSICGEALTKFFDWPSHEPFGDVSKLLRAPPFLSAPIAACNDEPKPSTVPFAFVRLKLGGGGGGGGAGLPPPIIGGGGGGGGGGVVVGTEPSPELDSDIEQSSNFFSASSARWRREWISSSRALILALC